MGESSVGTAGDTWGWAGSVRDFLSAPRDVWLHSLVAHCERLMNHRPSSSQIGAWNDEHTAVVEAFQQCAHLDADVLDWPVVFEYELPLEGGRRPDVVVLAGTTVVVLEFKSTSTVIGADLDQVRAYARDLHDYHKVSHGRRVVPILVLTGAKGWARAFDGTVATSADALARYLHECASDGSIDLRTWLDSPYEPLPTLVAAAKRIFRHEPLPHVWTALSAGIPQALEYLLDVCVRGEREGGRQLAFVTGVPGSGKTLVGLRLVYEGSDLAGKAAFLSGNGPLVEVLRDALKSSVFVKDLHKVILAYGKQGKVPREHILVFDEAQRAWDRERVSTKQGVDASEPDLLVQAGERVPRWSVLVGLVGEGQEIYAGEEAGMDQWNDAISPPNASVEWEVHCSDRLRPIFSGRRVHTNDHLDLTKSLRSRRAEHLHRWVALLLDGNLSGAARLADRIHAEGFPMYLTRDLGEAKAYARWRYDGEAEKRYGLVAASHDTKILTKFGVPNDFMSTKKVRVGRWYNSPPDDPRSCCALNDVVTEFGCQGLELDLPIVCWGADHVWTGTEWSLEPKRRRDPVDDPRSLLTNAYRVLLTRGRDGFVVYIPEHASLMHTEEALLAAGVRVLPEPVALPTAHTADGAA